MIASTTRDIIEDGVLNRELSSPRWESVTTTSTPEAECSEFRPNSSGQSLNENILHNRQFGMHTVPSCQWTLMHSNKKKENCSETSYRQSQSNSNFHKVCLSSKKSSKNSHLLTTDLDHKLNIYLNHNIHLDNGIHYNQKIDIPMTSKSSKNQLTTMT